jgi:hypothetical protein
MEPIIVSNQAEYRKASKTGRRIPKKNRFDIDAGKGLDIIKEVDRILTGYFYEKISKNGAEKSLSRLCFNVFQAKKITDFFIDYRPGDLYGIEQGLNRLRYQNSRELNGYIPPVHIKNAAEKIRVYTPVEVFGRSHVEAYQYAPVIARDRAYIHSFEDSVIYAYNNSNVVAEEQSRVVARNMPFVVAMGSAIINANDYAVIVARKYSNVNARHNALVFLQDEAVCKAKDNVKVITRTQNKPDFLKTNVLNILDHPYVNGNPSTAIRLLITAADARDINGFSKNLWEMGCHDPESTKKVLLSMIKDFNRKKHKPIEQDNSWER